MKSHRIFGLFLLPMALSAAGCGHLLWEGQREFEESLQGLDKPGEYLPSPDSDPSYLNEGSLWQASNPSASLFTDSKARQVNDIVTVLVSETSSATKAASTDASKDASVEATASSFFGLETRLANKNDFLDPSNLLNATATNDYAGAAQTKRDDRLLGTMTAVVQQVLPNGNLIIKGRRVVSVNDEMQYMILTGIIRTEDIQPNNTIPSSLIADARISYSGAGVVSDKQSVGWGSKLFDWIWPL